MNGVMGNHWLGFHDGEMKGNAVWKVTHVRLVGKEMEVHNEKE